jgi:hypothetical protein
MAGEPSEVNDRGRAERPRRRVAGAVALAALALVAAAWWWTARQPVQPDAGLGLPHGTIVAGAGTFMVALIAQLRAMSLMDVLEMLWDLLVGLFSLIGALLRGLWAFVCGLLGWD